jgi:uncharacterized protein YjcR
MSNKVPKRPGAPKGNQNARKHGFYSKTLAPWQQEMIASAADSSLDRQIALARSRIAAIVANDPKNMRVLNSAVTALARLLRRSRSPVNSDLRVADEVARIVSLLTTSNNRS